MVDDDAERFQKWAERWLDLARYPRAELTNAHGRIDDVVGLWHEPVPGDWHRGDDPALTNGLVRYGAVEALRQLRPYTESVEGLPVKGNRYRLGYNANYRKVPLLGGFGEPFSTLPPLNQQNNYLA